MTQLLPQLDEGRDGPKQLIKLVNQLRRSLPGPAYVVQNAGTFSLLSTQQIEIVSANSTGWVTKSADIIPDAITGAQTGAPIIRIGTVASGYDDVAPLTNLGTALVANRPVAITLAAPLDSQTDPIFVDVQTAGTGPTVLNATVYVTGYYRR